MTTSRTPIRTEGTPEVYIPAVLGAFIGDIWHDDGHGRFHVVLTEVTKTAGDYLYTREQLIAFGKAINTALDATRYDS